MSSNACWGIEVGSGALKAVKLVRDGDGVAVADFVLIPHKRPLSAPEIDEKEARRVALGTLVAQHDLSRASIAVSVPGAQSFARFAKDLPATDPKQIPALVEYEAKQQIPFPLDEVQWDYQTFVTPDSPLIGAGIFAIRTETVRDQLSKWQDVGRVPDIVTLNPLAAYNAIAWDQNFSESSPGTVIVDVGTTSTDLIVADGAKLWVRTFPMGGHQFTEALVTAFNINYAKAEKLKAEAETSQHARHILQALRPVFADLAADVQRSIGFYLQSQNKDAKLTRVVCLGSTFQLPGLKKFLSQQLQMEVQMLEGFSRISKVQGGPEKAKAFNDNAFQFASALGLALQGLELQTISANLVPASVVKAAMWKGKTKWFGIAAAVAVAAGGAMFIRPLMNSAAAAGGAGGGRPAVLDEVKRVHDGLKVQWTSAEGEYQPDAKAPVIVQVVGKREVMPKVLDDVGAMLASASAKLGALPGDKPAELRLADFASTYSAPAPAGSMDPTAPADPNAGPGKLKNRLVVRLSRDGAPADRFIENELVGWLKANKDRSGIYTIENVKWSLSGTQRVAEDGSVADVPRNNPGVSPPTPVTPAPGRGPGLPPGPGGGEPLRPGRPTMLPGGPGGGGFGGPGLTPAPAGDPAPMPNPTDDEVNKLAPLPKLGGFAPGSTVSTMIVEWDAAFKPAQPKQEGQQ